MLAGDVAAQRTHDTPLMLFPSDAAWDLSLNNILQTAPAFKNDRGFFPISDNRIVAYDVQHGTLLWISPGQPVFQPTVGADLLFEAEADAIVALRDDTGVEAWRTPLKEPLGTAVTFRNGWLVASTVSGTIMALRASDGAVIWQRELGALVHAAPCLSDDRAYIPMVDGRIIALQLESGEPIWERRLGGAPNAILATSDLVYAGATDNYFYAVRVRDGIVDWRWPTGANVVGRPAVDKQHVYFVSFDNILRALDKNTGNQRWKRPLPLRPTRDLVSMDQTLIVSGVSPSAIVVAVKDGAVVGSMGGPGELAAAPYVVPGDRPMVLLVSRDLAKGTILRLVTRVFEPQVLPMAPLPNPVPPPVAPEPLPTDDDQPVDTDRATEDAVMP